MLKQMVFQSALLGALTLAGQSVADPVRFSTIDYAPYALTGDALGRDGLIVDIVSVTAEQARLEHINSVLPISRVIKDLASGVADCGVFLQTGPSKAAYEQVAKIYDRFDTVIVARAGLTLTSVDDLKGSRLAIPRGSFEGSSILEDPEIKIVLTNDVAQSVALLVAGRVDAVSGTELSILYELSLLETGRDVLGEVFTYERQEMWLQCAKDQLPEIEVEGLRQAANALREGGAYADIMRAYTEPNAVTQ